MALKLEGLFLHDRLQSLRYRTPNAMIPAAIYPDERQHWVEFPVFLPRSS